jgi:hypothetical protein
MQSWAINLYQGTHVSLSGPSEIGNEGIWSATTKSKQHLDSKKISMPLTSAETDVPCLLCL